MTFAAPQPGMLAGDGDLFLTLNHFAGTHPGWGYALAFTEAAMVGGLADWFAVTALFRRPLGLPIPHTAIIPENKDRIAATMAVFLRDNFLTAPVIARRMRGYNIAGAAGTAIWPNRGAAGNPGCWPARRTCLATFSNRSIRSSLAAWSRRACASSSTGSISHPCSGSCSEAGIADGRHLPVLEGFCAARA